MHIYIYIYIYIYTKIIKPKTRCVRVNIKQKNQFSIVTNISVVLHNLLPSIYIYIYMNICINTLYKFVVLSEVVYYGTASLESCNVGTKNKVKKSSKIILLGRLDTGLFFFLYVQNS